MQIVKIVNCKRFEFILCLVFALLILIGIYFHEPWRDEIFTINVCKNANGIATLWASKLYTGHPFLYYLLIYLFSKLSSGLFAFQIFHGFIAIASFSLIILNFNLTRIQKAMLIGNYYLLFEFGILSRSYAFVVFGFILFLVFNQKFSQHDFSIKYFWLAVFSLIFVSNMQLEALPIAFALFAFIVYKSHKNIANIQLIGSVFCFISFIALAYYSAKSPVDGWYSPSAILKVNTINFQDLVTKWNIGFLPISNFKNTNWWNLFIFWHKGLHIFIFCALLFLTFYSVIKKLRIFYAISIIGSIYFLLLINGWGYRHYSFAWIAFFCFYILSLREAPNKFAKIFFTLLLLVQMIAGAGTFIGDIHAPFSNSKKAADFIVQNNKDNISVIGTQDYCLDPISFYLNKEIYYLGSEGFQNHVDYKGEIYIDYKDSNLLNNKIMRFLNKKNKAILVMSNSLNTNWEKLSMLSDQRFSCVPVFKTNLKSIVHDEDYFIFRVEKR
jgi:hypothetical protein